MLLKEVRMTRWLGRLLAAIHLSPIIDALDYFVAHQRGWLSRFVPNGSALRRFPCYFNSEHSVISIMAEQWRDPRVFAQEGELYG